MKYRVHYTIYGCDEAMSRVTEAAKPEYAEMQVRRVVGGDLKVSDVEPVGNDVPTAYDDLQRDLRNAIYK